MTQKIFVVVDDQGNIVSDFMGFASESCKLHEQRFRQLLAEYGVKTKSRIVTKSPKQIESEIAGRSEQGAQSWTKTKL